MRALSVSYRGASFVLEKPEAPPAYMFCRQGRSGVKVRWSSQTILPAGLAITAAATATTAAAAIAAAAAVAAATATTAAAAVA
ncbi:MAG: hypothetical protein H0T60_02635, partial [Acidobacteria bacterium]|nr:hypothetical protein [Acidobacteriota bacterium]